MRPLRIPEIGRLNHNISGDATAFLQKYCIIFGQPPQAEPLFSVGCYFYTHFKEDSRMKRPNGTGTIVKLPGKRRKPYAIRISDGVTISQAGRVVQKRKYVEYFKTAREAQEYLDRYNGTEDMTEKVKMSSKKDNPTFATVYEELISYMEDRPKKMSDSFYKSLNSAYNNLSGLHKIKFKNIDYEILQKEIAKNKSLSQSALNNIKNLLRKMYKQALKKKYVAEDLSVLCDYDFKKTGLDIHSPFSRNEIQAIYDDVPSEERDMLLILLYTGIRAQELLMLETSNVYLDERYFITGVKTAAGKNRIIPIHNDILPIVQTHFDPNRYYYWDVQGSQRIYQTLRWRFDRYLKKMGLNHLPHDTRHTTATLMHDCNMPEMYIKLILGHRIDDITQKVYIHTTPDRLVTEMNKVNFR